MYVTNLTNLSETAPPKGASFTTWNPKEYLREYYAVSEIPLDGIAIYGFLSKYFAESGKRFTSAIEVGAGPTLHHAFALIGHVEELHLADYLPENLEELRLWLQNEPGQHDWDVYIQGYLKQTTGRGTLGDVAALKRLMRTRTKSLVHVDLLKTRPIEPMRQYSLVGSFYCADSATGSIDEWRTMVRNLFRLVEPGGAVLLSLLRKTTGYASGDRFFPSPNVSEVELEALFAEPELRVAKHSIVVAESGWAEHGFDTVMVASADVAG